MTDAGDLITQLVRNGVDFVVVGGIAALVHGATLSTLDLDICCDFSTENLMRLQAALADLHPVHRMTPQRPPLELTGENCGEWSNLYLDTDAGQLDCLSAIEGLGDFQRVKEQSVGLELDEGVCQVLSLDALIEAKDAMDRPRDRQAAEQLRAIRERLNSEHA